jgi:hypothetical protein
LREGPPTLYLPRCFHAILSEHPVTPNPNIYQQVTPPAVVALVREFVRVLSVKTNRNRPTQAAAILAKAASFLAFLGASRLLPTLRTV